MAAGGSVGSGRGVAPALRRLRPAAALLALLALCGCATAPHNGLNDPFEQTNRAIFRFNDKFNTNVTLPVAWVYVNYVPRRIRTGVHNVLDNVESPVTFANDLLQADVTGAGETLARFLLNSTMGLGGLVDVGKVYGLPAHESDFGQTLARYGVPSGPFLVLPLIGPSTPRDILGTGVDLVADPLFYMPAEWTLLDHTGAVIGIHTVSPFEKNAGTIVLRRQLGHDSVDPYATMRSVYRQQRAQEIEGGGAPAFPNGD